MSTFKIVTRKENLVTDCLKDKLKGKAWKVGGGGGDKQ